MLIEKSRSGVYQDTPENRRLHRVGQRYGESKKPEEEDFESFADRYEKEYRKKHSGSPVKNSEIRYEASKEWDKMHSSENRHLHRVGQKYGEAKKLEEKKGGDNAKGVEIVTSRAGIKAFLSGKVGGDYYKAVAEAYNALRRSGKSKTVDLMLKESGSGSPSKDIKAKVYVKAVNNGATHDEAVKFADDCYKEFLAKIENVQQKVHNEGVNASAATKMFDAVTKWLNAQEFEKKAVLESDLKKDEAKQEGTLPKVNFSEKDFRREVNEEAMEKFPNAKVKLHRYLASPTDYYDNDGNLMHSTPAITEFYSDRSYSSIGGYQIYFDRADSIGLFKTKESAIAALNKYVNAMKVKGHSKPKWTYDKLNSRYRWNYTIPTPPEKQSEEVPSKVEKQPVKENGEKQGKPTSRVTFADIPRSREVNLKKYLTDSRRKQVDHLMKAAEVMPKSTVKQMHDEAVKKFNDNFDNLKKSERASALYVIMKYKDLMNKVK